MTSQQIVEKYLTYYKTKGHVEIPAVPVVPQNDPSLLFVNSGMFPLVPYLMGQSHPMGTRLVNVQRCVRFFEDLDNIGETNRHTTAFHMLGNWSLNDYFKAEQLPWVYNFLINDLGLEPNKLYATVFEGDADAPKDVTSISILGQIFASYGIEAKEQERIFAYGKKDNWWKRGDAIGELGGPDSEIFYYIGKDGTGLGKSPAEFQDEFIEVGNSVFIQYKKTTQGWEEIAMNNVDFGGGLERLAFVLQNKTNIFETDNFWPIIETSQSLAGINYGAHPKTDKALKVLADHARSAVFLAMDGVTPSNKDQGYVLRRLLRRMLRSAQTLGITKPIGHKLVETTVQMFSWLYPDLPQKTTAIQTMFNLEEERFSKIVRGGSKLAQKTVFSLTSTQPTDQTISDQAFRLYQSVGYPPELFIEDVIDAGIQVSRDQFDKVYKQYFQTHQETSRKGMVKKFKSGLADHSDQTIRYHTATHLLHWALRQTFGDSATQQGSNITGDRLRFDVALSTKLTDTQITTIQNLIDSIIDQKLPVKFETMPKKDAEKTGALHFFGEKYTDSVTVYYIGHTLADAISKEFCSGPHVLNTGDLAHVTIYNQEKIGENTLRLYLKFKH